MRWMLLVLLSVVAVSLKKKPSFEVASVKPSPRDPSQDRIDINLGRAQRGTVTLANTTLSECIRFAWGLAGEEQIAGPDWIRDRQFRYHFTAKAASSDTP